jgi:hypothetical protein
VKKPAAVRRPETKRAMPRAEVAQVDGLARTELELPDGRYLLAYARSSEKQHA